MTSESSVFANLMGSTNGVLRGWKFELAIEVVSDKMLVLSGVAVFPKTKTFYWNGGSVMLEPPNGRSLIVVRRDSKKQLAHIQTLPTGWHRLPERVYNWFTRRYVDIPLAWVECEGGAVTKIEDKRVYSAYYLEPR